MKNFSLLCRAEVSKAKQEIRFLFIILRIKGEAASRAVLRMRPATLGSAASACIAGVEEAVLQRIFSSVSQSTGLPRFKSGLTFSQSSFIGGLESATRPTLGSAASACMAGVEEGLYDSHSSISVFHHAIRIFPPWIYSPRCGLAFSLRPHKS